ncbi:MAG: hypothetical protein EBX52_10205 [Proteobacteria bacterium]|nr:hypothetical protein [Pseudomonadota bacterium]
MGNRTVFSCLLIGFLHLAPASTLAKEASPDPVAGMKSAITDKSERDRAVRESPDAKKAVERVKSLGLSPSEEQELYQLSADLAEGLVKDSNGDTEAMGKKIEALTQDPSQLEKSLTPEQRKKIHDLSIKIESNSGKPPAVH